MRVSSRVRFLDKPLPSSGMVAALTTYRTGELAIYPSDNEEGVFLVELWEHGNKLLAVSTIDHMYFNQCVESDLGHRYYPDVDWDAFEQLREELYQSAT